MCRQGKSVPGKGNRDYEVLRADQSQLHPWIQFMKVTE